MKKEKRELTLGQLERKEKFEKKIPLIIILLSFCVFLALIITIIIADIYFKNDANINKICSVYICIELFLAALMIISYKVGEKTKNQIILKQKQMKLKVLKQLAKEFVSILDENSKKEIVDDCIKNIRLKNSAEDVQKIIIRSRCYYYDEDISDDELMEMFELKE